nr:phosphoserine aminotransferase [uncultured Pseudomonas sp.]
MVSLGHNLALRLACIGARCLQAPAPIRPITLMGLRCASPLAIAAGFDRHGQLGRRAGALGFACNEIGSFDLASATGLLLPPHQAGTALLGINLTIDPNSPIDALCAGLGHASLFADYLMLNLIAPRSAVLLSAEQRPRLRMILAALRARQQRLDLLGRRVPLAVKLRCLPGQVPLALTELLLELGYDGLLAAHDPGPPANRQRYHAWQNPDNQALACAQIERLRALCGNQLALMSVGGIQNAAHLRARLAAGAELVQVHTLLLHGWPWQTRHLLAI